MSGTFTGAGVGPGDPELMTLKAVRAIRECSVIAVPVSDNSLEAPVCEKAGTERGKAPEKVQNERKENLQDFCYNAGNSSGRRESR